MPELVVISRLLAGNRLQFAVIIDLFWRYKNGNDNAVCCSLVHARKEE